MFNVFFKFILFLLIVTSVSSCKSVEKYNAQIAKQHSVVELNEDVDFTYKKLQKLHPNLYQYISKDSLDYHFNHFKSTLNKPMTSMQFYNAFAPIITKIGQGHTSLKSAHRKLPKKEFKKKGNRKNIFRNLRFNTLNNKVYIKNSYANDSIIPKGSELLKINDESVPELISHFKTLTCGDGYNTSFIKEFPYKNIGGFYNRSHILKDSLKLTIKQGDDIYEKYIYAFNRKNSIKKDNAKKKKLTRIERKKEKKKKKIREKWEWKYGFNKISKQKTIDLSFIKAKDTSKTVAYLKIKNFRKGDYKEVFKEYFKKIDSAKIKHLIIDVRDNLGGKVDEIADLYSYLTTENFQFTRPSKMTKPNSWTYPIFHNKSVIIKILTPLLYPTAKVMQLFKVKRIDNAPHFTFKSAKIMEPKKEFNFNGKVYVLINGTSFSSSCVLSNNLQATHKAMLVGTETGGAYNSTVAGMFALLELPNSKNIVRTGLMVLDTPYKTKPDGYGVKPDKYIKVTDLNKDEQLEWILNDIH